MRPSVLHTGSSVTSTALRDLRLRIRGAVHGPDAEQWDAVRQPWQRYVDQHPLAVVEVEDGQDVVAAVRWSVANGVQVFTQPVGHGAGTDLRGALLLQTGRLDAIEIDLAHRTAQVGAGVSSGALCAALAGTGLTFLVGSSPGPSVVGMTLTGGFSWFGRAFGLASESIVAAEIVDGLGRLRRVTAVEEPELWWALRGGGGGFGIVLSLELALHPVEQLHGGRLLWPVTAMAEVLPAFRAVCEAAPDALTTWFQVVASADLPRPVDTVRGQRFVAVLVAHLGTKGETHRLLSPLRAVAGLVVDEIDELTVEQLLELTGEPTEPQSCLTRSALLDELDDVVVDRLLTAVGPGSGTALAMLQVRHLGGALTHDASGCHGSVPEHYTVLALGMATTPEDVRRVRTDGDRAMAAVAPTGSGRTLMNFLAHDEECEWWDETARIRLEAIKRVIDPLDTIRSNRPVAPATGFPTSG
ncbi:FAD-binding oxidoreductase [Janibacter sp. Soil728]|uniref:FAD-binding oxidoreductase n=1 Tax=Janibacter sp. Soil728 TaxID=1736393 RepID=UPI000AAD81EF|nr:FAD-binding oxidoreductase [Janibacter sp. Soil728]